MAHLRVLTRFYLPLPTTIFYYTTFLAMRPVFLLLLFTSAIALDFQGTGQIRTLQANTIGTDLGCLTSQAQWTADNTQCNTFSGTRKNNYTITLNTSTGVPLGLNNIDVAAQEGLTATTWMVSEMRGNSLSLCQITNTRQLISSFMEDCLSSPAVMFLVMVNTGSWRRQRAMCLRHQQTSQ